MQNHAISYSGSWAEYNYSVAMGNGWKSLLDPIESVKTTSMENVSTGVLDRIKEHYLKYIDKAEKSYDVLRHTIAYVKIKKWRLAVHYVKPTAQLLFKSRFQKVDQHAGGKWLIHDNKRHKDYQLQSLKLPCPSWVSWCDIKGPDDDPIHLRIHASSCFGELM